MYSPVALLKYRTSAKGRYNAAKTRRSKAGHTFTVTFDEWRIMASMPCHYCGGPLNPQGLGLDRVDNAVGYTFENVVPCCKKCNVMKNNFLTHDEMKVAMAAVLAYRGKRD